MQDNALCRYYMQHIPSATYYTHRVYKFIFYDNRIRQRPLYISARARARTRTQYTFIVCTHKADKFMRQ